MTCLPIVQQVLQGFAAEPAFLRARESMLAFPIVEAPLGGDVWLQAVDLYRSGRRLVLTIRSGVDCLIAAYVIRHQLKVLHFDRDFDSLTGVGVESEEYRAAIPCG